MKSAKETIRVGIVDSGCRPDGLSLARDFRQQGDRVIEESAGVDQIGHGSSVEDTIRLIHPRVECLHARVFHERPVTTPAVIAAGLLWLKAQPVDIICLSLGLKQDREVLAQACGEALADNIVLVAASPTQGNMAYPAAYDGVIAATGDARCEIGQITRLNHHGKTVYGNWCASPEKTGLRTGGASIGCAAMTGLIARLFDEQGHCCPAELENILDGRALHRGREYRSQTVQTHA